MAGASSLLTVILPQQVARELVGHGMVPSAIVQAQLHAAAHITGSREEKIMLSQGDQAYIEFPKDAPLHAGERFFLHGSA